MQRRALRIERDVQRFERPEQQAFLVVYQPISQVYGSH
jgi:hypothetical protein